MIEELASEAIYILEQIRDGLYYDKEMLMALMILIEQINEEFNDE